MCIRDKEGDHGRDKDGSGGESAGLPVEAQTEQQAGDQGSDECDQAEKKGAADHLGALFHGVDLCGAGFGFDELAVPDGLVAGAHILAQAADNAHETNVDGEDEKSGGREKDGRGDECLEEPADVVHGCRVQRAARRGQITGVQPVARCPQLEIQWRASKEYLPGPAMRRVSMTPR